MLKTTILKHSIYYHDKEAGRHLMKVEGPCEYCGKVIVTTHFGTEGEAEKAHVCEQCRIERQKTWTT